MNWGAGARGFWSILLLGAVAVLGGCAEGQSYELSYGERQHFLTMRHCEREATRHYLSGGPKYSGFVCRATFLGYTLETRDFYLGKRS